MSSRPTSERKSWLWPVLLVVAALMALGYLAVRGIALGQETMLTNLRAELLRQMPTFLQAATRDPMEGVILYPLTLAPAAPDEDQKTFRTAMADEPVGRRKMLPGIRNTLALAPSGAPLSPLVKLELCRLATDDATLATRVSDLLRHIVMERPSILTPRLLAEAEALLRERSMEKSSVPDWNEYVELWSRNEAICSRVRYAASLAGHEVRPHWILAGNGSDSMVWVVETNESPSRIRLFTVQELFAKRGIPASRALASYAAFGLAAEVSFKGVTLVSDAKAKVVPSDQVPGMGDWFVRRSPSESLARGERNGLVLNVLLESPEKFRVEYWRQASTTVGLIVASFVTVALGLWAILRSLARERRLGEMKSNFVSSVSHELRAPVASMQLMAENLDTGAVADDARKREYHRLIADECRRLGSLIENVLDFSRIEQGRKTYRFAETDAAALVRDAVRVVQPRADARKQRIVLRCEEIEPVCDGFAVQQAVVNLLDNAIKFSPEGKSIAVTLRRRDAEKWEISVSDEGPGVPAAEKARIFERFYRAGSELTRETQGTGIGLSIVKHIAEAHGGTVEVNDVEHGGAKFTLLLPMEVKA